MHMALQTEPSSFQRCYSQWGVQPSRFLLAEGTFICLLRHALNILDPGPLPTLYVFALVCARCLELDTFDLLVLLWRALVHSWIYNAKHTHKPVLDDVT